MSLVRHLETVVRYDQGKHYTVDAETGCWNWNGPLSKHGYPFGYVYRKAWEDVNGPRPAGYDIHHKCKNRACINPEHLEPIHPRLHDLEHFLEERGGLTLAQVYEIRARARNRSVSLRDLAKEYGVHLATIYNYLTLHSWADILGEPVEIEPGTCAWCGGEVHCRRDAKYCSAKCRCAANSRRQWERTKAQRAAA